MGYREESSQQPEAWDLDFLDIYDEAHSEEEDRFIAIGPIKRGLIVVVYTERQDDSIRVISARMATPRERHSFDDYLART